MPWGTAMWVADAAWATGTPSKDRSRAGRRYAQQIESQIKLVNDPVVTEYVNRIGQNLVRNSDAQVPFTIKVIDSDVVNAMALPGGFFYVNSGLDPGGRRRSRNGGRDGARNRARGGLPLRPAK